MTTTRRAAITLLPVLALAAWLTLAAILPPRHTLSLPQPWPVRPEAGQPLQLELTVSALRPPTTPHDLSGLPDGLLLTRPTTTQLDGIGWRGPRWRQTLTLTENGSAQLVTATLHDHTRLLIAFNRTPGQPARIAGLDFTGAITAVRLTPDGKTAPLLLAP